MTLARLQSRLIAPLLLTAALAACGGTAAPASQSGTTAAPASPSAASAAPLLSQAPIAGQAAKGQYYRPAALRLATIGNNEEGRDTRFKPVVDYIGQKLGIKMEYVQTTTYSSVIEAMRAGRVDAAQYGPLSYVVANQQSNAIPVAAIPQQTTGLLGYHSEIITHVNSGITEVSQLKGKTFAFADPASTSGYLFPQAMLVDDGVADYKTFFKSTSFSGSHQASLVAIAANKVDGAGVCDTCIAGFFQQGIAKESDIRVLQTSALIPPSPWAMRADLDPAIQSALKQAFVNMPPDVIEQAENFKAPPKYPYQSIDDSAYDPVRQLADKLHLDLATING
jgi:phosphonate transport system substrate-binding protein